MDASSYGRIRATGVATKRRTLALAFPPRLAQTICLCARRFPALVGWRRHWRKATTKTSALSLPTHSANISAFASCLPLCLRCTSSRMAERLGLSNSEYKRFIYTADFDTMRGRGRARPSTLPQRRSWRRRRWTCSGPRRRRVRCRRCTP